MNRCPRCKYQFTTYEDIETRRKEILEVDFSAESDRSKRDPSYISRKLNRIAKLLFKDPK